MNKLFICKYLPNNSYRRLKQTIFLKAPTKSLSPKCKYKRTYAKFQNLCKPTLIKCDQKLIQ